MGRDGLLRWIFAAALVAGTSYMFVVATGLSGPLTVVWKGAGVALLASWCAMQAQSRDGWLIAAVMAFGALGDALLETAGMTAGALAFLGGHSVATRLYTRNERTSISASQRGLAITLGLGTPVIAWTLTYRWDVSAYGVWLGLMACTAWTSRFPRYRTGIGAVMFVASDLLIFAKLGPLAGSPVPGLLIWPLYFAGQALIAYGVVRTLTTEARGNTP